MKSEKDFIKWIDEQVKYYLPILGLQIQRIKIIPDDEQVYLGITCVYPYLNPKIKYSKEVYEDWKKGKLKKDRVLHELCHILTDPLYVKATERYASKGEITDEREKLTDTIASIIRNLLND